jgi:PAS domain S-box-containing protein
MTETAPTPRLSDLPLEAFARPLWAFDFASWRIVEANAPAVALWGRDNRDALFAHDFSAVSPAVRDRLESYRRRLAAGERVEEDWTLYPPTGPVFARCLCSPVTLDDGAMGMLVEATRLDSPAHEGVTRSLEAMRLAGAAIAMFDLDGRLIVANPIAETLLGLGVEGHGRMADLFAEPKRGSQAMAWAAGGAIFDDEAVLRTPHGERWFTVRIHPAHDPATGAQAFVVSAVDVHRRRMAEQRLSESERARVESERQARDLAAAQRRAAEAERMLREAIESLDEGFLLVGRDDRIVMANRRYGELYPPLAPLLCAGTPFVDMIRQFADVENLTRDGSRETWVEWRIAQMRNREEHVWEQHLADGRTFLVNERLTESGNVVSLRTDVTRLKRVEAELRERVQAIEAANDGIAITDADGRFIFMNRAHAALLCGTPEDFVGTSWSRLYDPQALARFKQEILPEVMAAGRWRGEVEARRLDGALLEQEVSLSRLDNDGLLCVTRDIGQRKAAEAERARLQQQLFQSQKMDSLGRLAGGIAHDFNNILASMLGYAAFLVEDLEAGSEQRRYAEAVVSAGKRAQDLIGQILAFGRAGERRTEAVAVHDVVGETVRLLEATLPPGIELASDIDADGLSVAGDRTQLTQIVMNLAVNARDAIGRSPGRIVFSLGHGRAEWPADESDGVGDLRLERGDDGTGRVWLGRPPEDRELVELCVSDTGCGMSLETMASIFEPFFTTKTRGQGTGLGLAAVHGLVVGHGGAISVESRPGDGTTFRVLLPVVAAAPAEAPPPATAQPKRDVPTVLVVDDEEAVRAMLAVALSRRGYATVTAASGAEALQALEAAPADAVISDQTMPGLSGLELMRAIHVRRPGLPVLLCTGYSETLDPETAEQAGAAAFLHKPIQPDALIEILAELLSERAAE